MAELNDHIKNLSGKLQHLVKQYTQLLTQNKQLQLQLQSMQEIDTLQQQQIASLEQERLILKASVDKMDEQEKKQLEQKINGYLKNIDKCISLLSHKSNI